MVSRREFLKRSGVLGLIVPALKFISAEWLDEPAGEELEGEMLELEEFVAIPMSEFTQMVHYPSTSYGHYGGSVERHILDYTDGTG